MYIVPWISKCDKCGLEIESNAPPILCPACVEKELIKLGCGKMVMQDCIKNNTNNTMFLKEIKNVLV